jgi:hypothetical protein
MAPMTGAPVRLPPRFLWWKERSRFCVAGFSETGDVRHDEIIGREMAEFFRSHGVRSIGMTQKIIGCPHEEGIDYPEREECPQCPFWKGRDRWAGVFGKAGALAKPARDS